MRRLRNFLGLSRAERRLTVKVAVLLGMVGLALRLLPFRTILNLLDRTPRPTPLPQAVPPIVAEPITRAVVRAARYVLGSRPCLAQALTTQLLLRREGWPARVHVGVARGDRGEVQAHAWVESEGKVVIGGSVSELAHFTPILILDSRAA
jgi:hypothetical protein